MLEQSDSASIEFASELRQHHLPFATTKSALTFNEVIVHGIFTLRKMSSTDFDCECCDCK
jgi:hypothetical protein